MGQESRNTAVVEARVAHTTLATCAKWLLSDGRRIGSRSDLIRQILETVEATIIRDGGDYFRETEQAIAFLSNEVGLCNRSGRGGRPMNAFSLAKKIEQERGREMDSISNMSQEEVLQAAMQAAKAMGIRTKEMEEIEKKQVVSTGTPEDALVIARRAEERAKADKEKMDTFIAGLASRKQAGEAGE